MRKKHLFAKLLYDTKALALLAPTGGDNLIVFNYHRIRPDDPSLPTPFDDGVYGPTASQFQAQMRWLKQHRKVLSEQELIDGLQTGKSLRHCAWQCIGRPSGGRVICSGSYVGEYASAGVVPVNPSRCGESRRISTGEADGSLFESRSVIAQTSTSAYGSVVATGRDTLRALACSAIASVTLINGLEIPWRGIMMLTLVVIVWCPN